jgi:hypothetical protein
MGEKKAHPHIKHKESLSYRHKKPKKFLFEEKRGILGETILPKFAPPKKEYP